MNYILDTCVISELVSPKPNTYLLNWLKTEVEDNFYISVLTLGEIEKGIAKLQDSKRKKRLISWVENDLKQRFAGRIIPISLRIATEWGKMQASAELQGKPLPSIDGLIAATALSLSYTIVTRNTSDMKNSGAMLFNPWQNS